VQLYIHDPVASIVQPVRRLRGFQRLTLAAGQKRTLQLTLGRDDVGFHDSTGTFFVEPGRSRCSRTTARPTASKRRTGWPRAERYARPAGSW
jgi:fibronectin type III domain protein